MPADQGATQLKIYGVAICFNASYMMLAFLVPVYALHLGYSVVTIGFLAALPSLLQIPVRTISGALTDVWGELPLLRISFLACVTSTLLLAADARLFAVLAGAQVAVGLARSLYWVPVQSYLSHQPGNRARALGLLSSTNNAGALGGILAAGPLAGISFPVAFAASTVFAALSLAGTFLLPALPRQKKPSSFASSMQLVPRSMVRPDILLCGVVSLLAAVPQALVQSFYPVYVAHMGDGTVVASVVTSLRSGGMICVGFLVARMYRWLGWRRSFAVAGAAMALSLAGTAWGHPLWLLALSVLLAGASSGTMAVLGVHMAIEASGEDDRGTNIAIVNMYFALTMFAVPFGFGLTAARIGLAPTFGVLALVVALIAAGIAGIWRRAWPTRRRPGPSVAT